jgi:hypothetical protein
MISGPFIDLEQFGADKMEPLPWLMDEEEGMINYIKTN